MWIPSLPQCFNTWLGYYYNLHFCQCFRVVWVVLSCHHKRLILHALSLMTRELQSLADTVWHCSQSGDLWPKRTVFHVFGVINIPHVWGQNRQWFLDVYHKLQGRWWSTTRKMPIGAPNPCYTSLLNYVNMKPAAKYLVGQSHLMLLRIIPYNKMLF